MKAGTVQAASNWAGSIHVTEPTAVSKYKRASQRNVVGDKTWLMRSQREALQQDQHYTANFAF